MGVKNNPAGPQQLLRLLPARAAVRVRGHEALRLQLAVDHRGHEAPRFGPPPRYALRKLGGEAPEEMTCQESITDVKSATLPAAMMEGEDSSEDTLLVAERVLSRGSYTLGSAICIIYLF